MKSENWQTRAVDFAHAHNLSHTPSVYALDLMGELGEVAKEILLGTDYGKRPYCNNEDMSDELGDVLFSLCQLTTATKVVQIKCANRSKYLFGELDE